MAKLTIEIEENEFALYDVNVYLNGEEVMLSSNYTSEDAALQEVYEYISEYFNV